MRQPNSTAHITPTKFVPWRITQALLCNSIAFCSIMISYILHFWINLTDFVSVEGGEYETLTVRHYHHMSTLCNSFHLNLHLFFLQSSFEQSPNILTLMSFFIICCCFAVFFAFVLCYFFRLSSSVSESSRYCSVTSSDSVAPRRLSTTPTTRCSLGCGPTAPPICRGTGMPPPTPLSLPSFTVEWQKTHNQNNRFSLIKMYNIQQAGFFFPAKHGCVVLLNKPWLNANLRPLCPKQLVPHASRSESLSPLLTLLPSLPPPVVHSLVSSSSLFSFIPVVSSSRHPSSIPHLFSGRQKLRAGLFFKSWALLVVLRVSTVDRQYSQHII